MLLQLLQTDNIYSQVYTKHNEEMCTNNLKNIYMSASHRADPSQVRVPDVILQPPVHILNSNVLTSHWQVSR